jgi:hypothetical protein
VMTVAPHPPRHGHEPCSLQNDLSSEPST